MQDSLRYHREKLRRQGDSLAAFRQRADELQKRIDSMPDNPRLAVARAALRHDVRACADHIQRVEAGVDSKEFEQRVEPYVEAMRGMGAEAPRLQRLPGSVKRPHDLVDDMMVGLGAAGSVLQEFRVEFEGAQPEMDVDSVARCPDCSTEMKLVDRKAQVTCPQCGYSRPVLDATTASLQFNSDIEFNQFSYKRLNHFTEWLNNVQGKESMQVPDETVVQVMSTLHEWRARPEDVTVAMVREALKHNKQRRYYDHTTQIACRITGSPTPRFTREVEDTLKLMFVSIQKPFERFKGSRKNMLSYSYCFRKFIELLGIGQDIPMLHFNTLKGMDKLRKQDQIFRSICSSELDWEFIPSAGP